MSRQIDWLVGSGGRAVLVTLGLGVGAPCRAAEPIALSTVDELVAALVEENAGRHIVLAAGTYAVAGPLFVPDGVTLEGSGVMSGTKLPEGFAPGTETRISASFPFSGDVLTAGDGVRRPDAVSDSRTVIHSLQNVYRGDQQPGSLQTAWQIYGGSGVPIGLAGEETRRNSIQFSSQGDSIEGFRRAILAAAGVRLNTMPAPAFDNTVDLRLRQVSIATPNDAASTDLSLQGAYSTTGLPAGTGNVLRVQLSGATGSGYRNNVYAHATAPDTPDSGNALVILGSATAFGQANSDLLPTPAAQFFIASD